VRSGFRELKKLSSPVTPDLAGATHALMLQVSVMITTNLSFGEWSQVFGDAKMTTALLDRFS
jgi:hypothetical protein